MERRFSVEAKALYFSVKADVSEIRLEERRKEFSGFIFLGLQCFVWLLATVEEALKELVKKDFVKSYRKYVKALMVCGGGNKANCYLEVATYAEDGRKGVVCVLPPKLALDWELDSDEDMDPSLAFWKPFKRTSIRELRQHVKRPKVGGKY